jgi:replication factor C subunit 2/4
LACNDSGKLIEPIQSRCAIVRFARINDEEVKKRVREVAEGGVDAIAEIAEGDMRNAMNSLQATYAGYGKVNKENVYKVCD